MKYLQIKNNNKDVIKYQTIGVVSKQSSCANDELMDDIVF